MPGRRIVMRALGNFLQHPCSTRVVNLLFVVFRLNHQSSAGNFNGLYSDSLYNSSLPPLPYSQHEKARSSKCNVNERIETKCRSFDLPRSQQEGRGRSESRQWVDNRISNDSPRRDRREGRTGNSSGEEGRRSISRHQPSPRGSRNHLNVRTYLI